MRRLRPKICLDSPIRENKNQTNDENNNFNPFYIVAKPKTCSKRRESITEYKFPPLTLKLLMPNTNLTYFRLNPPNNGFQTVTGRRRSDNEKRCKLLRKLKSGKKDNLIYSSRTNTSDGPYGPIYKKTFRRVSISNPRGSIKNDLKETIENKTKISFLQKKYSRRNALREKGKSCMVSLKCLLAVDKTIV